MIKYKRTKFKSISKYKRDNNQQFDIQDLLSVIYLFCYLHFQSRIIMKHLVIALLCVTAYFVNGQGDSELYRSSAKAFAIDEPPVIDGNILEDPVWQDVETIGPFTQNQPNFGLRPSEKTDVRIAYTPTTLYVSAVCYDSAPERLVVQDAR